MPGSETVLEVRSATFPAVMPVASSLTLLRAGSRPNSGQSVRPIGPAALCAGAGIALATASGVGTSGALEPQAARTTLTAAAMTRLRAWRGSIA